MNLNEKQLSATYYYQGQIVNMRVDRAELPNGAVALREVVEHPGGVCIAALTDRQELLFVRQFRYPYGKVIRELPAGKLAPGEDPLEAAKRELAEETGAVAAHYQPLGQLYPSPGFLNEIIHLYLATDLTFGRTNPDEDEFLEVERIPLEQAVRMVLGGQLTDAKTQVAVLKVWHILKVGS